MSSIFDWSTTASDNSGSDSAIDWTEGMNSKKVNDSSRQMMGRVAEWLSDIGGQGTVGGTANAITLSLSSGFSALTDGLICTLLPATDNSDAVTLNVNSIGAKAIRKFDPTGDVALASGDLQAGMFYLLIYSSAANSSAGAWVCLNPTPAVYQAASSKLTDIAALTPTDSNFIVGNGTTWVAETGSTVRTSLGLGTAATTDATAYATAAQGTKADAATPATNLASTASGKGASLVGIQDSGGLITATTVEGALAELATKSAAPNAVLEDQKSSGTNGGTFSSGAWRTRTLTTKVRDPDSLITLSSNQFTPTVAGWVEWSAPAFDGVTNHKTGLYCVTDSAFVEYGTAERTTTNMGNRSFGGGAVASGKTYEIRHYAANSQSSSGLGSAFGDPGVLEIYTRVQFWRV